MCIYNSYYSIPIQYLLYNLDIIAGYFKAIGLQILKLFIYFLLNTPVKFVLMLY